MYAATELVARIHASGRIALVQPYLPAVEERGETSVVFIGGEISHVLTKRPVLRGQGVAPIAEGKLRVAVGLIEPRLYLGCADGSAQRLADAVLAS